VAERDPKGNIGLDSFAVAGKKAIEGINSAMGKGLDDAVKKATALEKLYDKIYKTVDKTTKAQSGKSSSSLGLGEMGPGAYSLSQGTYGGGMSRGQMLGMGAMAIGAAGMGIMPSTMTAVSQRLAAEQIAMYSTGSRGARGTITSANSMVGRGNMTSAMGPTMAMGQVLSQGGYGVNSLSTRNIMGQVGGMSAASGMSNEGAAGAYASQNGMNLLRLGIRLRDPQGNVRKPNEVVNDLYARLWRGSNPPHPEAMFSPGSIEYQTIMAAAGGSQEVFQLYTSMLMLRVKNKKPLTSGQMKNAGNVLNTMGVKGSVQGNNFNFQSSQNRLLGATEQGLVGGYNASLTAAAGVNNGMAALGEVLPGVVTGLAALKGVLETLPMAGGAGATMSGAAGGIGNMLMMRAAMGGGRGGAGALAAGGAKAAGGMGKGIPVLGALLNAFAGYQTGKGQKKFNWKSLLSSVAISGGTGAMFGGLPGAVIGALIGGAGNAGGQLLGMNQGGGDSGQNIGGSSSSSAAVLNPGQGFKISSDFGARKDPNGGGKQHHNGIDYEMPVGTPVLAAADGIVDVVTVQANSARSYGRYIVLKHEGFYTYYAHLSKSLVKVGQKVRQGQQIGLSGGAKGAPGSGSSTGPHLHFEIKKQKGSSKSENPKSWFGKVKSSIANLFGSKSDDYKNFDWTSPSGLSTGSQMNVFGGSRISQLISQGGPLSFDQLSNSDMTSWAKAHGPESVGNYLDSAKTNTSMDSVSGDGGSMAFGSRKGLISALYKQGFRGKSLETAFAVALAESGGRAKALGDTTIQNKTYGPSMGVFQIRSLKDPKKYPGGQWRDGKRLLDPSFNVKAAWNVSKEGTNWKPWSAYKSGAFSTYLDDAQAAARQAGIKVGRYGVERTDEGLTYTHKDEVLMTKLEADKLRNRPSGGGGGCVTVNMNVSIASAGVGEVQILLQRFKAALEQDKVISTIGSY
jgi:murein DD-endopeptidase MepM/ murein hydrolase activator NlpD